MLDYRTSAVGQTHSRDAAFIIAGKNISDAAQEKIALWRNLLALIRSGDEAKARASVSAHANAAASLYLELLFDAVDVTLYDNPPFAPEAARIRHLLVEQSAPDSIARALEAKFARWSQSKERAAGAGFTRDGEGAERIFYLYILAKARHADAKAQPSETQGAAVDLTETARARRNAGDREDTREALASAIDETKKLIEEIDARPKS